MLFFYHWHLDRKQNALYSNQIVSVMQVLTRMEACGTDSAPRIDSARRPACARGRSSTAPGGNSSTSPPTCLPSPPNCKYFSVSSNDSILLLKSCWPTEASSTWFSELFPFSWNRQHVVGSRCIATTKTRHTARYDTASSSVSLWVARHPQKNFQVWKEKKIVWAFYFSKCAEMWVFALGTVSLSGDKTDNASSGSSSLLVTLSFSPLRLYVWRGYE